VAERSPWVRIPPSPPTPRRCGAPADKSATKTMFWYVYILKCGDGKFYTGCTNDLKDRMDRHSKRRVFATKNRLPVELISYFAFSNKDTAFSFEKYLKSGSGGAFIGKHGFLEV
jgi:putative endonuclease